MTEQVIVDWMPEARQIAAQCWCEPETSGIEMDSRLAEAFARRIAVWMESWAQEGRNVSYYRGLLLECAKYLGHAVYISDDGSVQDAPLLAKVPELVRAAAGASPPAPEER